MKKALITGVTGQDGSYLAELLLEKGYQVFGLIRRSSTINTERINHLISDGKINLIEGDMSDAGVIHGVVRDLQADEIYNLAAQSHVGTSFKVPEQTADVTGFGVLRILEAIKCHSRNTKLYQASSSEMFGNVMSCDSLHEDSYFAPASPYACAKVFAHNIVNVYRKSHGIYACCGILFNHESPRRGENFVTRKITRAVGRIKFGLQDEIHLGNIYSSRDWGYAKEYVEAMWLMLQQENKPSDFVIATGENHTVKEFLEVAFAHVSLDYKKFLRQNKKYERPNDVHNLCGGYRQAKEFLGWKPETRFKGLVKLMVDADMALAKKEALDNCYGRL